jgi:hypothetical protein
LLNGKIDPTLTELELVCKYFEMGLPELFEEPASVPHPEIVANLKRFLRATRDPLAIRRIRRAIDGELQDLKDRGDPKASGQ